MQNRIMAALVVLVCLIMAVPLFFRPGETADFSNGDWRQLYFHHKAARDAVLDQGEPGFWSPYVNGGFPLAAHPHDPSFSPLFPIILAAGEILGCRINVFLIFLAGTAGMALYTRRSLGFNRWGVFSATALYAVSGWLPARLFGGNYWETFYYLFPLIAFCLAIAGRDKRYFFAAVLLLYLLLAEANFVFPVTLLFLGLLWLFGKALPKPDDAGLSGGLALKNLILAAVFACLVGAVKFYLLTGLLAVNPRAVDYQIFKPAQEAMPALNPLQGIAAFWEGFIKTRPFIEIAKASGGVGPNLVGPEYIGCGGLALALACLSPLLSFRRYIGVAVLLGLSIAVSFSLYLPFDLFAPLSRLPVLGAMYNTVKYFNFFILFFICIGFGGFFHTLFNRMKHRNGKLALALFMAFAAVYPLAANRLIIPLTFFHDPPEAGQRAAFSQVLYGPLYINLMENTGVIKWHSSIQIPTNAVPSRLELGAGGPEEYLHSYRGEAWLASGRGEVRLLDASYNRIRVHVDMQTPGLIVINQNYDPGWSSSWGRVVDVQGLLGVHVTEPGEREILLIFRPKGIWIAAGVGLAALLLLIWECFMGQNYRSRGHSA
ncbi:hypothetical protein Dalk_2463 [Desulfatibacillum aliphaticivorans]|uniref:Membrane protein 6-pyruvoyl-tetrahydropterin synthase-related domain-containing protein n=1 Tax=Desulfatibacillum aliphaticivorans TaxID=218208 RepID=B8FF96_DESAL|nr:hypothetical protein [Desulfatibacillum aliphaticivorans]ACL04156.1 hypothetical protein Dalk_2463 [Desulfatibacillum aliphaticivorans]